MLVLNSFPKYDEIKVLFKQHLSPAGATAAAPIQTCPLDLPDTVCALEEEQRLG